MSQNSIPPIPPTPGRRPIPPRRPPAAIAPAKVAPAPVVAGSVAAAVSAPRPAAQGEIVAGPAGYYRATRFIMVLLLVASGMWFTYDGWWGYPKENAKVKQLDEQASVIQDQIIIAQKAHKPAQELQALNDKSSDIGQQRRPLKEHTYKDLLLQQVLGFALPLLGLFTLWWSLHISRGVYRMADQTIFVPGHPPVPLSKITTLDKELWDRKGIAFVEYKIDGVEGRLKLDDYIYQRDPTDEIFKRIEEYLSPPA